MIVKAKIVRKKQSTMGYSSAGNKNDSLDIFFLTVKINSAEEVGEALRAIESRITELKALEKNAEIWREDYWIEHLYI